MMTAKAIGKRIKAKGLGRLRWYCQICEKQCRDANGYSNHINSESHLRKVSVVSERSGQLVAQYSSDFKREFLRLVTLKYNQRRVLANQIYNEFVQDRHHTHMNSTKWVTLTGFIHHLQDEGLVELEETPRGWFMTYIGKDPVDKASDTRAVEREQMDRAAAERAERLLAKQIELAHQQQQQQQQQSGGEEGSDHGGVARLDEREDRIEVALAGPQAHRAADQPEAGVLFDAGADDAAEQLLAGSKRKASALQAMMEEDLRRERADRERKAQRRPERTDHWLARDIVVKVRNKKLADGAYHKRKGTVRKVVDKYVGELEMLDSGDVIRVDQDYLETVIPSLGSRVLVVNGRSRGATATLEALDEAKFAGVLRLDSDRQTVAVPYEDFSKLIRAPGGAPRDRQ